MTKTYESKSFVPSGRRVPYHIMAQLANRACKSVDPQLLQLMDAWPRVSWEDVAKVMRSR